MEVSALQEITDQMRAAVAAGDPEDVRRLGDSALFVAALEKFGAELVARHVDGGKFRSASALGELLALTTRERTERLALEAQVVALEQRLAEIEQDRGLRRAA